MYGYGGKRKSYAYAFNAGNSVRAELADTLAGIGEGVLGSGGGGGGGSSDAAGVDGGLASAGGSGGSKALGTTTPKALGRSESGLYSGRSRVGSAASQNSYTQLDDLGALPVMRGFEDDLQGGGRSAVRCCGREGKGKD